MTSRNIILSIALLLSSSLAFSATTNPLQGSWEWVNIKNSCTEIYTFGIENTAHISSGQEISDASYTISDKPTDKGFYKVSLKIVEDKGGMDCGESVENNTGDIYNKYVMFHPHGNHYVSCDEEDTSTCVGPFRRLK